MKVDHHIGIGLAQPFCHLLGTIYRAVLSTSAAKADAEMRETTFKILVDTLRHENLGIVEELSHSIFALQELYYRAVFTCVGEDRQTILPVDSVAVNVALAASRCSASNMQSICKIPDTRYQKSTDDCRCLSVHTLWFFR